jgi:hypothetical protein
VKQVSITNGLAERHSHLTAYPARQSAIGQATPQVTVTLSLQAFNKLSIKVKEALKKAGKEMRKLI